MYVASPNEIALGTAFDVPLELRFSEYPKTLVEKAVRKLGPSRQIRATVLPQRELSLTASARPLAAYLVQSKAEIALVASHARKGVSRLFLGSFAEALVHAARTDLLVFHEGSKALKREPGVLLFAHDLSEQGDARIREGAAACEAVEVRAPRHPCPGAVVWPAFRRPGQTRRGLPEEVGTKIRRIEAALKRARIEGSVVIDAKWAPVSELILARAEASPRRPAARGGEVRPPGRLHGRQRDAATVACVRGSGAGAEAANEGAERQVISRQVIEGLGGCNSVPSIT